MTACPVRKLEPEGRAEGPDLEPDGADDGTGERRVVVRSFDLARRVLRAAESTSQAGFGAEQVRRGKMRPPILYLEGASHREQRRAAARLFAPKVVEGYRPLVERLSRDLLARLDTGQRIDLSQLAMQLAVGVAAEVVGLTNSSRRGMTRRLDTFFSHDVTSRPQGLAGWLRLLRTSTATWRFYVQDVLPAVRARRRHRRDDVISQLLDAGFSNLEVLTECLTYGAAGMVTTREFITMSAWHLLDDADLLRRFRAGDAAQRRALLEETLRLEPVVGHLYRRVEQPMTVPTRTGDRVLEAGTLVALDLRAANADEATVGEQPYGLCPGRELPSGVPAAVLSFGDGHHRCPGGPLAVLEAEVFLSALLERDLVAEGPPRVRWNPVSQGYDLDGLWLRRRPTT